MRVFEIAHPLSGHKRIFMDYNEFEIEDFLKDENFVKWATNPTGDQSFFWNAWLSRHPHKLDIVLKAKELISSVHPKNQRMPSEEEFLQVLENVMKNDRASVSSSKAPKPEKVFVKKKFVVRYAAAASLLIGLLVGIHVVNDRGISSEQAIADGELARVSKSTLPGQKLKGHILPDGTFVSLNAASKISYPAKFSAGKREVFLEGEAFFDVKRDVKRPFLLYANGSTTKVLGTSFNVNAYPSENIVEIAVKTGKVAVYPGKYDENTKNAEMLLLDPKGKATINLKSREILKAPADLETILSWKENLLIFQNESFDEITRKLERWYGVKFQVDPSANPKGNWNGRFKNKSLEHVLKGLMFSSDLQFEIKGKMVSVTNKQ